jgi:hypothetical protein
MKRRALPLACAVGLLIVAGSTGHAGVRALDQQRRRDGQADPGRARAAVFRTEVPDHPADVILGRPTADSVTLSMLFYRDSRATVVYGPYGSLSSNETDIKEFKAGEPAVVVLGHLRPDTRYAYSIRVRNAANDTGDSIITGTFRTQRAPGAAFTFTVTADSHLDERTDPAVYARTLRAAAADDPDFHVDLGDTFMTERHPDRASAARQYLAQRYYFGLIAHAAPLFLALGNHDGEDARRQRGGEDSSGWALAMRVRYFPNPAPDAFYSGNRATGPQGNLLQDYYAWSWGDARFIVLDPFWYSDRRGGDDGWGWTLGPDQYQWLVRTLAKSDARFTFVFIHHLVGGADRQARGGAEASRAFEWGGMNADGTPGFSARRPGWAAPIHDLLVKHGVTAVFHGHDHLHARQERDGIIYQEVPQPGDGRGGSAKSAGEYGYKSGVILAGTGYVRVRVAPEAGFVEFVDTGNAALPARVADRGPFMPAVRPAEPR